MSELHFDAEGEPVRVPADAEELRVRRFRKPGERGACEVVHGAVGAPLFVPADTSYLEFRKLVDNVPGRYRLDPVDESRRACSGSVPLYVTIDPHRNGSTTADDRDSLSRELVRAHVEMMRNNNETMNNLASHFASMMTATAEILRAADGAGLPRRDPPPPVTTPADDDDEDDQEEEDDDEREPSHPLMPLADVLAALLRENAEAITAYTTAKIMGHGKAGSAPTPPPAATPPVAVATPTPIPAPAAAPAPAVAVSAPASSSQVDAVAASTREPTTEVRNAAPQEDVAPSPAQIAHLMSISKRLTPEEQKVVMVGINGMVPEAKVHWLAKLCSLSVDDAVVVVRSMMPPLRTKQTNARETTTHNSTATKESTP
jgi:hypothetical protein